MNRYYLIFTLVLSGLFAGVYWQHRQTAAAETVQKQAEAARAREAAGRQKAEAERKAREDAEQRTAARLAAEQKQEAEQRAKWETDSRAITEDTRRAAAELATATRELKALEDELTAVRALKEKQAAEAFTTARAVEEDRIRKRNAELEIQRLTEILVARARATASSLARVTP